MVSGHQPTPPSSQPSSIIGSSGLLLVLRLSTVAISVSSLNALQRLVMLVLVFQLSTLLLVIAGPVPPRPAVDWFFWTAPIVTSETGHRP